MKKILFLLLFAAAFTATAQSDPGGGTFAPAPALVIDRRPAVKGDFAPELATVTAQLKAKFDNGQTNAADLKASLKDINDLIVRHIKEGNREQVSRLYLLDAHIYADGFKDTARARAIWNQIVRDFPGTLAAQGAAISVARLDAALAAEPDANVPEGLEVGQKFPGFNATALDGNPLSVAAYKGRVTMIDFWATWCPPCRAEMPNVIAIYNRHHTQGFDIIGVSLDQDRDAVVNFTQTQGIAWSQYFDGQGWDNKLAKKYGVNSIPMTYLLDGHGVIIGKELRGEDLSDAVIKALANNH